MKKHIAQIACACALLGSSALQAANFNFHVDLNTASLIGAPNSPFFLDFQLNDGSGTLAGPNTATLTNFTFTGGNVSGSATFFGSVSGNLGTTVSLNDATNPFNEFFQGFSPTTTDIQFNVSLTTNSDGLTPDLFAVAILDSEGGNPQITTNAPDTVSLVVAQITSSMTLAGNVSTYSSIAPDGGVTATAVPEPSSVAMFSLGLLGMISILRRRHV